MIDDGLAYIVPVNFGMKVKDGKCLIYLHSALSGKKVDILRDNGRVSFEMDTSHALENSELLENHTYHYECVKENGHIRFVEDAGERDAALRLLMGHYTTKTDRVFPDSLLKLTHVLCLEIEQWSAKKH